MPRPGLAWAWRSDHALQLGLESASPVVLTGLNQACRRALDLMDGTRTVAQLVDELGRVGPTDGVLELIDHLVAAGAVIDAGRWPGGAVLPTETRDLLLPDLMARAPADPDEWWTSLAAAHVVVLGGSRLGGLVARSLVAAGVGRVTVDDPRPVTPGDLVPGGLGPADVGRSRAESLSTPPPRRSGTGADPRVRELHVVTDAVDIDAHARVLLADDRPFLVVACHDQVGRVGPFVIPGRTACQFCVQLHRRDHDPEWPRLWSQISWVPTPVALSTTAAITAHLAVEHVITWCGGAAPASQRGVVDVDPELGPAGFHRTPPHPECGCCWRELAAS